jgi:2-succinyl-5-enolpyruvyl-6-hydroxy-3-cyclohexene-1-carboxylate synthase
MLTNSDLSEIFIQQLLKEGISYFCFSPGSRNTPVILSVKNQKSINTFVHIDERGAAFHALGWAKGSGAIPCLSCTSGSALANYYPAIVEAYQDNIPLILITSDRPKSYQDRGINQTIKQQGIYSSFVHFEKHLDFSNSPLSVAHAAHIAYKIAKERKGPVHVNLHFDDKLFPEEKSGLQEEPFIFTKNSYNLSASKKGLIIIGKTERQNLPFLFELSQKLQWPIYCDILSQNKTVPSHQNLLSLLSLYAKNLSDNYLPEVVLHFGDKCIFKEPFVWLKKTSSLTYVHISEKEGFFDPFFLTTQKVVQSPIEFYEKTHITGKSHQSWLQLWLEKEAYCRKVLPGTLSNHPKSEPAFFSRLSLLFPKDTILFMGNSLPIRNAAHYFHPINQPIAVFANRGCSGIDGNIATAVGIAQAKKKSIVAILGDMTTLHDINSLIQCKTSTYPIILVVINNQGGGIFHHLPIGKSPLVTKYFQTEYEMTLQQIAAGFHLPYFNESDLEQALRAKQSSIVEINCSVDENLTFNKNLQSTLMKEETVTR